jgi:chromosome partitioning protein
MSRKDSSRQDNCKIISISNQKGGEGKTTVSICLSDALSDGNKTLLIDWDPQSNTSLFFLEDVENSIFDCLPYKGKKTIPVSEVIQTIKMNLDLLPCSIELANFTTPFERDDFDLLHDLLEPLRENYDYIIIDCPPSLGLILENAFLASDYVLIPIQTRAFSVQGIQDLDSTIKKIQRKANPNLKLLGAVLSQFEGKKALSGLSNTIKAHFPVLETILAKRETIPQSQAKRKLLSDYDPASMKMFIELANEIKDKINV